MTKLTRRKLLQASILGGLVAGTKLNIAEASSQRPVTPHEIEGPFYPVIAQKDKDFDLTQIEGRPEKAKGDVIIIEGRVLDAGGYPIEDATVELWQANAAGRYNHPHDSNTAPLDPNFQGWAIVQSGAEGGFKFKTIMPGIYPAAEDWFRPPHIHFKVSKKSYVELITQMYFPGHPLNEKDLLIKRKTKAQTLQMIASSKEEGHFQYDIVLERAQ